MAPKPIEGDPLGDPHNFGKRVQFINGAFHKPRSVFWEKFFFSTHSPLRPILENDFSFLFNLKILSESSGSGVTEKVSSASVANESWARMYGFLAAYCFYFGIYDLHSENIISAPWGPQVVDCESAFGLMVLPHEGMLFPYRNIARSRSGLWPFVVSRAEGKLEKQEVLGLISGFATGLSELILKTPSLIEELKNLEGGSQSLRVFLRPTAEYVSADFNQELFITEEKIQLARGDIPFFFSFPGKADLFFWNKPDQMQKVKLGDDFGPIRTRFLHALPPSLFAVARSEKESIFYESILFLAGKFFLELSPELGTVFEIGRDSQIVWLRDHLELRWKNKIYHSGYPKSFF